jgi:hypothetical protein
MIKTIIAYLFTIGFYEFFLYVKYINKRQRHEKDNSTHSD